MIVRDEADLVVDWVAHHDALGFNTILVLDDGSTDGTLARLHHIAEREDIDIDLRVLAWPRGLIGLTQAIGMEIVCRLYKHEFDWIAFFDADEFLVPRGRQSLADMLETAADFSAVVVPWLLFGSSYHMRAPAGLIFENFQRRAVIEHPAHSHVKSIVRPNDVIACLNPHAFETIRPQCTSNGVASSWMIGLPGMIETIDPAPKWCVHHYFTRSKQHWQRRIDRRQLSGAVRGWHEFELHDRNEVFDDSAAHFVSAVSALYEALSQHPRVLVEKKDLVDGPLIEIAPLREKRRRKSRSAVHAAVAEAGDGGEIVASS